MRSLPGLAMVLPFAIASLLHSTQDIKAGEVEKRVAAFLQKARYGWRDMNVPEADGKLLHDIIVKNKYTRALELGTSTGHSGIWMALALSKTGGRLTTVEIDEGRHREAVANFKEAGVSGYIDARLADAHKLVAELTGPFDFVFIDADKDWYVNYAKALIPKVENGGCLTAHNVSPAVPGAWGRNRGGNDTGGYYEFMSGQPGFTTSMVAGTQSGLSASYKKVQNK